MARLRYTIPKLRGLAARLDTAVVLLLHGRRFGRGLCVFGLPVISAAAGSELRVGDRAVLVSVSEFSEPGVPHPCVLRTLREGARLLVGDDVGMSGCSLVAAREVRIGDRVLIGAGAVVTDTDFHPVAAERRRWRDAHAQAEPVVVEDDVFLGMGAVVLKGVTVGRGAVVGAGSVVTRDVPPWTVVAGAPARVVGEVPDRPHEGPAGEGRGPGASGPGAVTGA